MLIQCPACHARAKIPDSKEGAKVRCGECGRVFVASPAGERGARGAGQQAGLWIALAVVGVLALVVAIAMNLKSAPAPATSQAAAKPAAAAAGELQAGDPVAAAVALFEAVQAQAAGLEEELDAPRIWAREQAENGGAARSHEEFALAAGGERGAVLERAKASLLSGPGQALVAGWKPFGGELVEQSESEATVRVGAMAEDGSGRRSFSEWRLARAGGRWKAWSWKPAPAAAASAAAAPATATQGIERVTLSDGSRVFEREPEPLGHLESTAPELRERIDALYANLIDLSLTRESAQAARDLADLGKPAIPILLTGLYEIPLDTPEQAIQVNLIDQVLRGITGQSFGYDPQLLVGRGKFGEERRKSAIRQWFAWWHANQDTFETRRADSDEL